MTGVRIRNLLVAACLLLALPFFAAAEPAGKTLAEINAALQSGEADKALSLLGALPDGGQNNAAAMNLACRVHFTLAKWDAAVRECEQAVHLDSGNSNYHLWLGRAYGEKANRASFLSAFSLGRRVAAEFQRAVQLDPRNAAALSDLGSFDVEAPSIVGGGIDKAAGIAAQLDRVDPARAWALRAQIDMHRKNYANVEADLKKAISVSRYPADAWSTLARFYQERSRWRDMDSALHNCMAAALRDPHSGIALYDAAGVLIRARRNPALAAKMLEDYVHGDSETEEAPAFVAWSRLAALQHELGDEAAAQKSTATARALAREYNPAQDLRR